MAVAGAGYLAFVSLVLGIPPAGCGPGSACGEILSSSWAKLVGVPVSIPALGIYLAVIGLAQLPPRLRVLQYRAVAAGAIGGAVVWFVILQALVLHAFCPYCMVDHILGLAVAVLLLVNVWRVWPGRWLLVGLGAAALMALGQVVQPRPLTRLDISSAGDFDRVLPGGRELGIQDGKLCLQVSKEPHFGPGQARTAVVLMFDYACPHCRRLHRFCRTLVDRSGDLLVIALPTPLGSACNRFIPKTEERFRESCELARVSLAVYFSASARWPDFDQWLFDSESPRSANEARDQAASILGNNLVAALRDERVARMLQRNVEAFGSVPATDPAARRLPVTWSPGRRPIVGPVESASAFVDWLNRPADNAGPVTEVNPSNPGGSHERK